MPINNNLVFPDITEIIYEEHYSLENIRRKYIDILRKTNLMYNHLYANKLEECARMLSSSNLIELEKEFADFKEYMKTFCKNYAIKFIIKYRQKDFIRLNNKIRNTLCKNNPLDRVRDLIGFRIVLITPNKDSENTLKSCYDFFNQMLNFFVVERHCIPLEAERRSNGNSKFNSKLFPDIVVPTKSLITKGFEGNTKDYIMHPKSNGYQSLHVVFQKPNGLIFEIQLRTFAMDIVAEKGNASHDSYSIERKQETDICLDCSKIDIPGFTMLPNGEIYDAIGLTKSIDPFNTL